MRDEAALSRLLDEHAIREVLYIYCRAIDRGDRDALRSVYHADATEDHGVYQGSAADFAEFALKLLEGAHGSSHNLTNILIDVTGYVALVESYFIGFSPDKQDESGARYDMVSTGRYLDRFERRAGVWKVAHRKVVFDWNQNLPPSTRWTGALHGSFSPRGRMGPDDALYEIDPGARGRDRGNS
jgi:hypothetical protein